MCIVSVAITMSACSSSSKESVAESTIAISTVSTEASTSTNDKTYAVTFLSNDGSLLKIDYVPENASAVPPVEPEMTPGVVFSGWKTSFSTVSDDMQIHPKIISLDGKTNVFAMPAAYGRMGESVIVPLKVCGNVVVSGFDIIVEYDPECLSLESVFNEDGGVIYNDEIPGQIRLNYVSIADTTADIDVCDFKFRVIADEDSIVSVCVQGICAGNSDDSMYAPEYEVINSTVYIYH